MARQFFKLHILMNHQSSCFFHAQGPPGLYLTVFREPCNARDQTKGLTGVRHVFYYLSLILGSNLHCFTLDLLKLQICINNFLKPYSMPYQRYIVVTSLFHRKIEFQRSLILFQNCMQ